MYTVRQPLRGKTKLQQKMTQRTTNQSGLRPSDLAPSSAAVLGSCTSCYSDLNTEKDLEASMFSSFTVVKWMVWSCDLLLHNTFWLTIQNFMMVYTCSDLYLRFVVDLVEWNIMLLHWIWCWLCFQFQFLFQFRILQSKVNSVLEIRLVGSIRTKNHWGHRNINVSFHAVKP